MKFLLIFSVIALIQFSTAQLCNDNTCQNKGVCVEKGDSFICNCPFSHYGEFCQYLNLCGSRTCLNGGMCTNDLSKPAGYVCTCPTGWGGLQCETPISCGAWTCGVLGRCISGGPNGFRCECPRTYTSESRCATKDLSNFCTQTGLFRDPVYCSHYIECSVDANGSLVAEFKQCFPTGGWAHYFNEATKTCERTPTNYRCVQEPF